ncbi:MAG: glycoside hydrolase family 127 protein [Clostridia bacterium]|nr:glycoside hydrolase family 127 protein [Clostridia bacterium]
MLRRIKELPVVRGELKERAILNAARMCSYIYRPIAIYTQDQQGWPGDWEGRTILALVSNWKALGTRPAYLDEIVEGIRSHLNSRGYLGRILEEGSFDEQQFSGHNWLIRGLMEYYLKTGSEEAAEIVKHIVEKLYLPARGHYAEYPLDPEERGKGGSYGGNITGRIGSWITSTDIGCAFMCLDGLAQYYSIFGGDSVKELLDEMIGVFTGIDFVSSHMQTHATLSGVRGILGLYEKTGDKSYLAAAERIFGLYLTDGMTENYANFNWFGRFDTWTEPCAITDSMMVAFALYRALEDTEYLKLAQRIYYNAFCYAQRSNGGFGTDTTVGPETAFLRPSGGGFSEAFWCCTMRGAEGISTLFENFFLADEDRNIIVTIGGDAEISTESFTISFSGEIPYGDSYRISVTAKNDIRFSVKVMSGDELIEHVFDLKKGEKKSVRGHAGFAFKGEPALKTDGIRFFYGNLLLGTGNGDFPPLSKDCVYGNGLQPLTNMKDVTEAGCAKENRQIVF